MSSRIRRKIIPYLVLFLCLPVVIGLTVYASSYTSTQDRMVFDQALDLQLLKISDALDKRTTLIQGIAGLFDTDVITRDQFQTQLARLQLDRAYPDVRAVGYSAAGTENGRETYSIMYLEPADSDNERAIGLDMHGEPVLRQALERARDSGLPSMSRPWNHDPDHPVLLLSSPVYAESAAPDSVEARRQKLRGFVFLLIRPGVFIRKTAETDQPPGMSVSVFTGNKVDPVQSLYSPVDVSRSPPRFAATRAIDVAGDVWTIVFQADPAFRAGSGALPVVFLAALGGIAAMMMFVLARWGLAGHEGAELRAEQYAKLQQHYTQVESQLREQRTRLNELISQIPAVVWEARGRPDGPMKTTFISDYAESVLGFNVDEWTRLPNFWLDITHPEDRQRVVNEIAEIGRTGSGATKFRWIARDGRVVWVEAHCTVIVDERGEPVGMRGITMDVTSRLRAEERLRDKEARLQIALSAARMANWHWDLVTGKLLWDDVPYTWTDFVQFVHPEDQHAIRNAMDRALHERQNVDFEFRVLQTGGSIQWLALKAKVFHGDDNRPAYMTGVTVDITDRRSAADALRASEERYRLAARATNDVIWDWHLATDAVEWNEGIYTLFGYSPDKVGPGVAWHWERVHPDDRQRVEAGINAVIKGGGRFWSDEYRFRCADGTYANVTDRAYIEHNESGQAVRVIAAMTDVTRLREAEREREQLLRLEQRARQQAESANRLKDEFLATISHELRTPITPILGWTQMLRGKGIDEATLQHGLDVIERNSRAQAKLIEDLLDVSRIVTGKMQLNTRVVHVQHIIQASIDSIQPIAESRQVRIETALDPAAPAIAADPDRLQQVIWNLLSNAAKFTPAGGLIRVSSGIEGDQLEIVVSDNGEGIDPEFLPEVFERFTQADSSSIRKHGGLGVGLAIVRYIVELHGGRVNVHSEGRGRGSTFTVTLPARKTERTVSPTRPAQRSCDAALRSLRLLVVDDDADARELLAIVLQNQGAAVNTANSAKDALASIQHDHPDILISDIAMPGEDGFALLEQIRELEQSHGRRRLPVIALTAYARSEDRKRMLEAGFEAHIAKPIEPENLISVIRAVADKYSRLPRMGSIGA